MTKLLDTCPTCGERNLTAICTVVAEYSIANDGGSDQQWTRRSVDDDTTEPTAFRCCHCGAEFPDFDLDENGYLTSLRQGEDEPEAAHDEVLVVIHISGGLVADCGCRRRDIPRLRIVVVDSDVAEEDPERGCWTETPTAVEGWPTGPADPLFIARSELPEDLVAELGIPEPTPRPTEDDG